MDVKLDLDSRDAGMWINGIPYYKMRLLYKRRPGDVWEEVNIVAAQGDVGACFGDIYEGVVLVCGEAHYFRHPEVLQ